MAPSRREPIAWPNNARLAMNIQVSFETWPPELGTAGSLQREPSRKIPPSAPFQKDLRVITDRQFGERVGVFRLLDAFQTCQVPSTFFINGVTAHLFPEIAREIKQAGHEIAAETYLHDYSFMKTPEQDQADIRKSVQAIEEVVGERPLGYVSTGKLPTDDTPRILAEEGFVYWLDPCNEEMPYTLEVAGKELVVLPHVIDVGDYSTVGDHSRTIRQALETWKDAFNWLYRQGEKNPGRLTIIFHPFLAGRPYRMECIEEFLEYARRFDGVWWCRMIDVVRWWLERYRTSRVEQWPNYHTFPAD